VALPVPGVDLFGQVIDVLVSPKRDKTAARRFFTGALAGATSHAFIQNLRRGHYELATDATTVDRVAVAFTELALAI
jgi:transposase-like protein